MKKRRTSKTSFSGLDELDDVAQHLKEQAKQKLAEQKRLEEIKRKIKAEENIFRLQMVGVKPLKPSNRVSLRRPKPLPLPRKLLADDEEVMLSSLSDELDVETLLDTDEALSFRRSGISLEALRKLRRGYWKIQAEIDLHGYRRDDAREVLHAFIQQAQQHGLRCVRVVHGKGLGSPGKTPILKARALSWLMQSKNVLAYVQARPADGGAGALVVLLRAPAPQK